MGPERSPLEQSLARSGSLLGWLLALLTVVLVFAAVLVFTIDESPNPVPRGFLLLGLAAFTGGIGVFARWILRRPPPVARAAPGVPLGVSASAEWTRRRLGPAWMDWGALALPLVLVALPLVLLRKVPFDQEAVLGVALIVGLIELPILLVMIPGRREPTKLTLLADGLQVTRRSGKQTIIGMGELEELRLDVLRMDLRGGAMEVGTLILKPTNGKEIRFREPMSEPLPPIANACAQHMRVEVVCG